MNINKMTIEEFRALPHRKGYNEDIGIFDSLIILPDKDGEEMHDSGYRCMDFVAVRGQTPICRLSGYSDVIHIGGLIPLLSPGKYPVRWSIDCLPASGLLRLFASMFRLRAGHALSSFDIYVTEDE